MAVNSTSSVKSRMAPARRTAGWVTATGLVVLAATAAVAWSWRKQLPDPVAVHWGTNGPNGYASLNGTLVTLLGPGVLLVLGFGAVILLIGQSAVTRRVASAATVWSALFLSLLLLGSLYVQRGLSDARDA